MNSFRISALDALMFRDGRPFNQGDAGTDAAVSRFPPPPPTIAGALRLLFANALGYKSKEDWKNGPLGDGANWQASVSQLDKLEFSALLLTHSDKGLLYPCPLHLARAEDKDGVKRDVISLLPRVALDCDLGREVWLPAAETGMVGVKIHAGDWLTREGMEKVLSGGLPASKDIVEKKCLYEFESRVGIGRDADRRTAIDGALYTASFVRLRDGVSMVQSVNGVADAAVKANGLQRFGGEHRSAFFEPLGAAADWPKAPAELESASGKFRYAALTLAPVIFNDMPRPGGTVEGLAGQLVSACLGKPQMLGGWDSQDKKPLPLRAALPAGSVFFMETDDAQKALARHGGTIGVFGAWGFGQVLIARWNGQ
jgi:CRISPR-associated protein Cmr3